MPMSDLVRKLKLKAGARAALLYAPEGYRAELGELPAGVHLVDETGLDPGAAHSFDFVHLFVSSVAELDERAPQALAAAKPDGFLWISYPKKTGKIKTDIHRDAGWDTVQRAGWQGVALISVDDTWSAMRFRPVK